MRRLAIEYCLFLNGRMIREAISLITGGMNSLTYKYLGDQFAGYTKAFDNSHNSDIIRKYQIEYTSDWVRGSFVLQGKKYLFQWDQYYYEYRIKSESEKEFTIGGIEPWWLETDLFFTEFQKLAEISDK